MLTNERKARLRQLLLEQRVELERGLAALDESAQDANLGLGNHMADDGTAAFDQAAAVSLHRSELRALEQVDQALNRLDHGTYGRCERCEAEIDFARLKAVPQATMCMDCQRLIER